MSGRVLSLSQSPRRQPPINVGPSLMEFFNMSIEAKALVRERWVAQAFSMLPGLTEEEKRLARDKELARECALWRCRFREISDELQREKLASGELNQRLDSIRSKWIAAATGSMASEDVATLAGELGRERDRVQWLTAQLNAVTGKLEELSASVMTMNDPPQFSGVLA